MKNFKQFLIETSPSQYSGASDYDRRRRMEQNPEQTRKSETPSMDPRARRHHAEIDSIIRGYRSDGRLHADNPNMDRELSKQVLGLETNLADIKAEHEDAIQSKDPSRISTSIESFQRLRDSAKELHTSNPPDMFGAYSRFEQGFEIP